jgi:[ribosomal protein S5]-alanine N-acetyltransferase
MAGRIMLETERLLLREFDEGDAEPFYVLGTDPAVTRYTGDGGLTSVEHALEILRGHPLADYRKHGFGRWACVCKDNGQVIGFAGLKRLEDLGGEVDLGYRFLPAYWGSGLATEAGRAVLNFGFERLRLEQIIGLVDPANVASVRILEKLGMTYTGTVLYLGQQIPRYVTHARQTGKSANSR